VLAGQAQRSKRCPRSEHIRSYSLANVDFSRIGPSDKIPSKASKDSPANERQGSNATSQKKRFVSYLANAVKMYLVTDNFV
jgi:hypothetical protein